MDEVQGSDAPRGACSPQYRVLGGGEEHGSEISSL